jgi:hypothetical protein
MKDEDDIRGPILNRKEWKRYLADFRKERRRARHPLKMLRDMQKLGITGDRRRDA